MRYEKLHYVSKRARNEIKSSNDNRPSTRPTSRRHGTTSFSFPFRDGGDSGKLGVLAIPATLVNDARRRVPLTPVGEERPFGECRGLFGTEAFERGGLSASP
jgi:hypothetical protein